ncbi:MAG: pyridoxamine 5'-phosphate oxidase family protein, partial [Acidobacteria bacterium]|nr:pyridoxamine 5'-phosphate oxidase family protein [Acidobacteriota bacterium]
LARETMRKAKYPVLATAGIGGGGRARPVSPVKTEGFTVWVASLRSYGKTAEIEADAGVELCYLDDAHDQVRITGRAVRIGQGPELQAIWDSNPLMRSFLGSIDNPELIVYRIEAERVRFMREWALRYHEVPLE